ncbi:hypothetical protein [Paenibacillus sp. FJAT-26967]|uniref:hypothetical protein n=1 Tax=Paenibacillus sp. FJAT-26967 TaxID=1729690 RepID=UPI000837C382|nr:hypothetical protein [Paenibacillus sp. FJAT-26967]
MSQVAFWAPARGHGAATSNVLAVSTMIALDYFARIMITHTRRTKTAMENAFSRSGAGEGNLVSFCEYGMSALERLLESDKLTPERIQDYTKPIVKDRLDLLPGSRKGEYESSLCREDTLPYIVKSASRYYDVTFVDVGDEADDGAAAAILRNSDLIVVNLSQNIDILERYFDKELWVEGLHIKPLVLVLGNYDENSKYNAVNIARKYKWKQPIYTVPHFTGFLDASNEKNVLEFFLRNRNVGSKHPAYAFITEVRRLSKALLNELGVDTNLLQERGA